MFKFLTILTFCINILYADTLTQSMNIMQQGIEQVQFGFISKNEQMIRDGLARIQQGNTMLFDKETIKKYLPKEKLNLENIALNSAKRVQLETDLVQLYLDEKSYQEATKSYLNIINACTKCHGITKNW